MTSNRIAPVLQSRQRQREAISSVRALKNIIEVLEEYGYDDQGVRRHSVQVAIDDAYVMLDCAEGVAK